MKYDAGKNGCSFIAKILDRGGRINRPRGLEPGKLYLITCVEGGAPCHHPGTARA
jgi:hypothetical protein